MGTRVGSFSDAQPDTDQGNTLSAEKVKEVVEQMKVVAAAQRAGLVNAAAGAADKTRLRRQILSGPVAHLAEVGRRASRKGHEVGRAFRYKPGAQTYVAFLTAVRSMQSAAEAGKQLLLRYGLSESVLTTLGELVDQFEAAVLVANDGRTAHKGATKQLDELATELASVVRTMDARNRIRFQGNRQLLESWISASTVLGSKRGGSLPGETQPVAGSSESEGTPAADGDVRPAA
jgi:hypothetical protein